MIRVFNDEKNGFLHVERIGSFPLDLIQITEDAGIITLFNPISGLNIAKQSFDQYLDREGNVLADLNATLAYLNQQVLNNRGHDWFPIWAEENADASGSAGGWQYAYGNGDNTPQGGGIVLPFDAELMAGSLNIEGDVNVIIEIQKTGNTSTNAAVLETISSNGSRQAYQAYNAPKTIEAGKAVNFRTATGDASSNGVRPCAWLRRKG